MAKSKKRAKGQQHLKGARDNAITVIVVGPNYMKQISILRRSK
jgi:hypothetical protein